MFFVDVAAHSKWLEGILISTITSSTTIKVLYVLLARFRIPKQIVSSNGLQFVSDFSFSCFFLWGKKWGCLQYKFFVCVQIEDFIVYMCKLRISKGNASSTVSFMCCIKLNSHFSSLIETLIVLEIFFRGRCLFSNRFCKHCKNAEWMPV